MVDAGNVVLWAGAVGMLAGTGYFALDAARAPSDARRFPLLMTAAGAVATLAYLGMALGLGTTNADYGGVQRAVSLLHYAAWLVVMPLLLAALWLLADADRRTLAALVVVDVLMVALGAAASLTTTGLAGLDVETTRLALWGASALAFLALAVLVVRVLSPQAGRQPRDVAIRFSILRNLTVGVWLFYPLVWLASPLGLALVGALVVTVAYTALDLLATVAFGLVLLRNHATLADA